MFLLEAWGKVENDINLLINKLNLLYWHVKSSHTAQGPKPEKLRLHVGNSSSEQKASVG